MQSDSNFVADKVLGALVIALSSCGLCAGLGAMGIGGLVGAASVGAAGRSGMPNPAAGAGVGALIGFIGFAIAAIYAINIAGGIGMIQGRRWGFMLTAILSGLGFLISLSGATGFLDSVPNLAICIYCALRLAGNVGPRIP